MKKVYLLFVWFSAIIICGCEKTNHDISPVDEQQEEETITVSLGLGGEITVSESPLTKASGSETSSNDLYGINVYYDKDNDGKIDDHYAYGLFDNVADMVITLVTGHKYKFECRMVVDGKNACGSKYSGISYYGSPFSTCTSQSGETYDGCKRCTNRFISGTNYFTKFKEGWTSPYSNTGFSSSGHLVDTYYGEITDYAPTEGGIVNINMKRCSYGLTVNLSGLTKGRVNIRVNPYTSYSEYSGQYTPSQDGEVFSRVISFSKTYECWSNAINQDNYSKQITIEFQWSYTYEGTSDTESFTKTETITLKRNVMTTVNINLNIDTKGLADNRFSLTRSETTMGSQKLDYNYNISLNGTVDNPVNP